MTRISFKEWLTSNGKYKDVINDITSTTKELKQLKYTDQRTCKAFDNRTLEKPELNGMLSIYDSFQTGLKNQGKFYNNYMKMLKQC